MGVLSLELLLKGGSRYHGQGPHGPPSVRAIEVGPSGASPRCSMTGVQLLHE